MILQFSYETKYGTFSDALVLPDNHTYTNDDLEKMKLQRRDNWISYIDSTQVQTPVETPTE